jgi:DNA-binding response OmpR family regulator
MSEQVESARIVVADDEPDIRRLVSFTLRRRGYEVLEAENGEEALALVLAEQPHLVVLDVMMPRMTGHEVARALRARPETAEIPILMVSAKGQEVEVRDGLASGASGYLIKPFAPRDLADRVGALLAERRTGGAASPDLQSSTARGGPETIG